MTSPSSDRLFGANSSMAVKVPCRVATTANITLSGTQTIDGVAVVTDDRVLVKNQTSGVDNGIYIADTGAWVRSPDFDGSRDITEGTLVKVNGGTVGAGFWYVSSTGTITPGTSTITFGMASSTLAVISAYIQTLLDDATAAAARATLLIETKSTVASAAAPDIWTGTGHLIDYTGTATATSFAAAPQAGASRTLVCAGAAVFTAGANMIIPGTGSGSNFTAAANTRIEVVAITTTQFMLNVLVPISTLGTGVATALAVNVGSAGAPVLFNGAGGTPSSLTLTNATGLPMATQANQESAVSTTLPVTPGRQQFHPSAAKAWCHCGVSGDVAASYNISSVTDASTGIAIFNWSTAFSTSSYSVVSSVLIAGSVVFNRISAQSSSAATVTVSNSAATADQDPTAYYIAAFGDQ